jgi:nucleoside-diphosphate-sugar epimerase
MNKVIITGASGFVGFALTKYLASQNIKVYALVRATNFDIFENMANVVAIDSQQIKATDFANIDCIYHLAWTGAYTRELSSDIFATNLDFALQILHLAESLQCPLLFASSVAEMEFLTHFQSIYDIATINKPYAQYKLTVDLVLQSLAKIPFIPVTITSIIGIGRKDLINNTLINNTLINIQNHQDLKFSTADQLFDFIYIDDAVRALHLLGIHGKSGRRYILGSNHCQPLKTFLEQVLQITNFQGKVLYGFYPVAAYLPATAFDGRHLREDTGFECTHTFEQAVSTMWQAINKSNGDKNDTTF